MHFIVRFQISSTLNYAFILENVASVYSFTSGLCCTGLFKKKVTLSHVYNEVTSEP
jgi:hypothetical protein